MKNFYIHFIRHGMTQSNLEGRYVGSTDVPVCKEGIEEIKELLKNHTYPDVSHVYSSDLGRALFTAEMIYPDVSITSVPDIREYHFGKFENKTADELLGDPDYEDWLKTKLAGVPVDGECHELFFERLWHGLDFIIKDMSRKGYTSAAVISHGVVMMRWLERFAMPRLPFFRWSAGNGKGYTARTSASMWMRDQIMEIVGVVPGGVENVEVSRGYENLTNLCE